MELQPRDIQTQVKHKILEQYLGAWGGIILNGLKGIAAKLNNRITAHFVYVDCFAHVGRYSGNKEDIFLERATDSVPGSPIIGIRSLDKLSDTAHKFNIDLKTTTILVEKDRKFFTMLVENLHNEGLGNRVKITINFSDLNSGEIAIINGDSVTLVDKLLAYTTQKHTWAFYLIDPYGPSGIPRDFVQSVVQKDKHDVMINFPYYDLGKKAGSIDAPSQQPHIGYWTKAFGDERWIEIKQQIEEHRSSRDLLLQAMGMSVNEAEGDPLFENLWDQPLFTNKQLSELTERKLVDLYRTVLLEMDPTLAVKTVKLHFPDKQRTMFYLILTTHDGTGALRLNEVLAEAKYRERDLQYMRRFAKRPPNQTSFLGLVDPNLPRREVSDRPTIEECAESIMQKLSRRTLTRRNIYKELADEMFFSTEIDNAIKFLKSKKRADYDGKLNHDTIVKIFR